MTKLVAQGRNLMHKENAALWKVRPLLTRLQGDHTWVPCGMMTGPGDGDLFSDDYLSRARQLPHAGGDTTPTLNGTSRKASTSADAPSSQGDFRGGQGEAKGGEDTNDEQGTSTAPHSVDKTDRSDTADGENLLLNSTNLNDSEGNAAREKDAPEAEAEATMNGHSDNNPIKVDEGGDDTIDAEMTEPLGAAGGPGNGPEPLDAHTNGGRDLSKSPDASSDLFIHPLFLTPQAALPDRDQSLPEQESEDIRRLLQLYVQKQEEVCRGTTNLYMGLLKADRYRNTVLKWAKAEAHCGERRDMSDGEDWYDKEEWGLVEDLKKGQDEEEEDTTVQTQKKTRSRK